MAASSGHHFPFSRRNIPSHKCQKINVLAQASFALRRIPYLASHWFLGNDSGNPPLPMSLSDAACENAKAKEKQYRLTDGDGLHLLVQTNGSKLWQLRYRYLEKENILSFGKYPPVTLAEARAKRDEAKKLLANGVNPAAKRREDKISAAVSARTTFGLIAEEVLERSRAHNAETTAEKNRWYLEDLAAP